MAAIPEKVRLALIAVYKGKCQYCSRYGANHAEHIMPESRGGTSELWNLTLGCRECNLKKGSLLLGDGFIAIMQARATKRQPAIEALLSAWKVRDAKAAAAVFIPTVTPSFSPQAPLRPVGLRPPHPITINHQINDIGVIVRRKPCYSYIGWGYVGLPHKSFSSERWIFKSSEASLFVEPREGGAVPSGSKARIILLYLQTMALRNRTKRVPLAKSWNRWIKSIGSSVGGKSIQILKHQLQALSQCYFTVSIDGATQLNRVQLLNELSADNTGSIYAVTLGDEFYEALLENHLVLDITTIRALSNKSAVLDFYMWLAATLPNLSEPTLFRWLDIKARVMPTYRKTRNFKMEFRETVELVKTHCSQSCLIDIVDDGLLLGFNQSSSLLAAA